MSNIIYEDVSLCTADRSCRKLLYKYMHIIIVLRVYGSWNAILDLLIELFETVFQCLLGV